MCYFFFLSVGKYTTYVPFCSGIVSPKMFTAFSQEEKEEVSEGVQPGEDNSIKLTLCIILPFLTVGSNLSLTEK